MASIRKEILIEVPAEDVWAAVRDVGEVHRRLAPGAVTDVRLEGDSRLVTFSNGMVVRELIVDIDDDTRRFAYAAVGGRARHHNATMQVFTEGGRRSRLVWVTDLLPNELAGSIGVLVNQLGDVIKKTLEGSASSERTG
ncbi:MAG: polyketide cyclase [Deltaproteobacteria bacterium RBG_13_49_15]|nr:MAG: polyketide cyclase [Deltaproteobacteria bacterium RBG_13_49_15]